MTSEAATAPTPPMVDIVHASVYGDIVDVTDDAAEPAVILHDLSLQIAAHQSTAILGANGSGKSTLVKLITRQLYPRYGGEVRIFGRDSWNIFDLRKHLGIVSSSMQLDFDAPPPLEALECVVSGFFASRGLFAHSEVTQAMWDVSAAALEAVNATHLRGRMMHTLSTGEARRVLIARALAHNPRALLLDEPCAGLDPAARYHFLEMLRQVVRGGTGILMITHHIEEILPEMEHVVMLRHGALVAEGAKADLLTSDRLSHLFDLPIEVTQRGDWYRAELGVAG